jgi:hypothetical protein
VHIFKARSRTVFLGGIKMFLNKEKTEKSRAPLGAIVFAKWPVSSCPLYKEGPRKLSCLLPKAWLTVFVTGFCRLLTILSN